MTMASLLQAYEFQVGGHSKADGPPESLVDDQGRFLKKLQAGERGEREAHFYAAMEQHRHVPAAVRQAQVASGCRGIDGSAADPNADNNQQTQQQQQQQPLLMQQLATWVPCSYGVQQVDGCPYLVMDNLTGPYQQPCVMDIKVGYRTWYPWASQALQDKYRSKDTSTTQATLGFRLCGVRVHNAASNTVWRQDRHWGKELSPDGVRQALVQYANNGHLTLQDLCGGPDGLIAQLQALYSIFEQQCCWHFYSTSLLLVYEGLARSRNELRLQVKLIDFAHNFAVLACSSTAPGTHEVSSAAGISSSGALEGPVGRDQNFLDGLNSLIAVLQGLLQHPDDWM